MNQRIALWPNGRLNKFQTGPLGSTSAFFHVASRAGTNDILPIGFSARTFRDNMVKRQFAGSEFLAAVLASVFITSKDISTIELDLGSREPVVE